MARLAQVHAVRRDHLATPYPNGESWEQAIHRVGRCLDDIRLRWSGQRVLVIGHLATRWALDHLLNGESLEDLLEADFVRQEGWGVRAQRAICLGAAASRPREGRFILSPIARSPASFARPTGSQRYR